MSNPSPSRPGRRGHGPERPSVGITAVPHESLPLVVIRNTTPNTQPVRTLTPEQARDLLHDLAHAIGEVS